MSGRLERGREEGGRKRRQVVAHALLSCSLATATRTATLAAVRTSTPPQPQPQPRPSTSPPRHPSSTHLSSQSSMTSLICNACQIQIYSDEERATHYKSEWHRYGQRMTRRHARTRTPSQPQSQQRDVRCGAACGSCMHSRHISHHRDGQICVEGSRHGQIVTAATLSSARRRPSLIRSPFGWLLSLPALSALLSATT